MQRLDSIESYQSALDGHSVVVIDFMASWCGPCNALSPIIEGISKAYQSEDINESGKKKIGFFKVDIDEMEKLALSLKVESVPAVIFFVDGKVCERIVGLHSADKIANTVENCLKKKENAVVKAKKTSVKKSTPKKSRKKRD